MIARAGIAAGARFISGYPGSPSSEILDHAQRYADAATIQVEWAVNEMVALQTAAAASHAGMRAIVAMKHNGLAVCLDFLESLAYTGIGAGLLLISCDDTQGTMSGTKGDARPYARLGKLPCIEPCSHDQIADAMTTGFALSERCHIPIIIRSTTALSHGSAPAPAHMHYPQSADPPAFDPTDRVLDFPPMVPSLRTDLAGRLRQAAASFDDAALNTVEGSPDAELLVVGVGTGSLYAREAITALGDAGIRLVALATVWPLPRKLLEAAIGQARSILVVEDAEPFVEAAIKEIVADLPDPIHPRVRGRDSGDLPGPDSSLCGILDRQQVIDAIRSVLTETTGGSVVPEPGAPNAALQSLVLPRAPALCAGCPHRSSLLSVQAAIAMVGEDAFVVGDIGCYGLGAGPSGYNVINVLHNMGASVGVALGFASLRPLGFRQRVLALVGDSTILHAGLPALVQAAANRAPLLVVVLDNGVTAMTGLQPNPATDGAVRIEAICTGMGIETITLDPLDVHRTALCLAECMWRDEPMVAVLRSPCALLPTAIDPIPFAVDHDRCIGSGCGCDRFCARVLGCPANLFDEAIDRAYIDTALCNGCGLCAEFCPTGAIAEMRA